NFIRLKYLRYDDDWIISICGPQALAEQVKEELKTFLSQHLKLTLSAEKTTITHSRKEQAHFLGTRLAIGREGIQRVVTTYNGSARPIKRRSTGSEMVMTAPKEELIKKLHEKGFCTTKGHPRMALYTNSDWKKQRNGFQVGHATVDLLRWSISLRSRSKLGMPCCICSSSEQVEMHHVRHIRKTGAKKPVGINAILQLLN